MQVAEKERSPRLSLGEGRNMVTQIMVVNLTIYIVLFFTRVIYNMENMPTAQFNAEVLAQAVMPADFSLLITRPWTIITHLFTHIGVAFVFSNMLWLYCFGTLLQNVAGHQRILPLYLFGGLAGAATYLTAIHLLPAFQAGAHTATLMGASASVMALAIGATTITPGYRIFPMLGGGIPLWIITTLFIALHVLTSAYMEQDPVYYAPLAGGAIMGALYMWQWKNGRDMGAWLNRLLFNITHVFHPAPARKQAAEESIKRNIFAHATTTANNTPAFRKIGAVPENRLNEILDKINELGIDALSAEERQTLLRASQQ
ncbi:rhomboid family intramembrane serine protease [Chitinophaga pendula]|uniref:rhomboid family intramembrane serine protease n=1 Tax=Chitinophaga TaxID=79328 RepID=UPI000BB0506D|nr:MULTISPECIES: rhomboid family intramembrane serine protease [Chitinophaga]ASZ10470.1 hypothetical protein CK934_05505 [Chitinophaga sp. MD30]UCJ06560.1 rhomboid family intramembrane serine protease [Chitinophaga pendula]